jgi:hypothetical protein
MLPYSWEINRQFDVAISEAVTELDTFSAIPLCEAHFVPRQSGCYHVHLENVAVYVGSTDNLRLRFREHVKTLRNAHIDPQIVSLSYVVCAHYAALAVERFLMCTRYYLWNRSGFGTGKPRRDRKPSRWDQQYGTVLPCSPLI